MISIAAAAVMLIKYMCAEMKKFTWNVLPLCCVHNVKRRHIN